MSSNWKNQLFFGDNLDILKDLYSQYPKGFIDLIYIDPPFNSKRNYNVLFESVDLKNATAQQVNHFIKTIEAKQGHMGVFICFADHITRNMQLIAKKQGLFTDDYNHTYGDKIQIISVEDLLEGKLPLIPQSRYETFKKAEKKSTDMDTQTKLEL